MTRIRPFLAGRMGRLRPQPVVIVLSAALVIAYGVSILLSLQRAYHQTLRDAAVTLQSLARSADGGTNQLLFVIDATWPGVDRMLAALVCDTRWDGPWGTTLLRPFGV